MTAGWAIVKLVDSLRVLPCATRQRARTRTRSPGAKGLLGKKLSPTAEEYARRRPRWRPLSEPATEMRLSVPGAAPRKLICVRAVAVGVPGSGEIVTLAAAAGPASGKLASVAASAAAAAARRAAGARATPEILAREHHGGRGVALGRREGRRGA